MAAEIGPEQFERLGPAVVEARVKSGAWNSITRKVAADWLAKRDVEARANAALLEANDREVARSGVDAAWVSADAARSANNIAKWALALSIVAIIVSLGIGILAVYAQLAA